MPSAVEQRSAVLVALSAVEASLDRLYRRTGIEDYAEALAGVRAAIGTTMRDVPVSEARPVHHVEMTGAR